MLTKLQTIKKPYIAVVAVLLLALLAVWVVPLSMKTAILEFEVPALDAGTKATVTITSEEAYSPSYTIIGVESEGTIHIRLDREYLSVDRVVIHELDVVNAVRRMNVCGSVTNVADYAAASIDSDIFVQEADGTVILSDKALETIDDGLHHPIMLRVYLTFLLLFAAAMFVLYRFVKSRLGTIKALTVIGIPVGTLLAIAVAEGKRLLDTDIEFRNEEIVSWIPVVVIMLLLDVLLLAAYLCPKNSQKFTTVVVVCVYLFAFAFAGAKILFYNERVANTPDETSHIGYVAYLTKTGELIPQFENIEHASLIEDDNTTMHLSFTPGTVSYLKHPPTFYHIARLANSITFLEDGTFTVDLYSLRMVGGIMVMAALALMFYIGFTRFKKSSPLVHLVFAAVCVAVPMLTYCASGVNNDSMTLLTVTVFFLGILRFLENKRHIGTYLLIAVGICATAITKLTAGIVVVLAALIVLTVTLIKEKNIKQLLSPAFLIPLVLYLVPLAYYLYMLKNYGSFQPNMFEMNPEYSRATGFYVDVVSRSSKSLLEYINYFLTNFMKTWTGVMSHINLPKSDASWLSEQNVALVAIWCIPFLFAKKSLRDKSPYATAVIAGCVGVFAAVAAQLVNGFNVFTARGYMGGFQSRYYLCAILFFAFGLALAVQKTTDSLENKGRYAGILRRFVETGAVLFVGMLFYEDILYFLMHFTQYIK